MTTYYDALATGPRRGRGGGARREHGVDDEDENLPPLFTASFSLSATSLSIF